MGGNSGGGGKPGRTGGGGIPTDGQLNSMSLGELEALDASNPSSMAKYLEKKYPGEKFGYGEKFTAKIPEWDSSKEKALAGKLTTLIREKRASSDKSYAQAMREGDRAKSMRDAKTEGYKSTAAEKRRQWRMDHPL